MRLSLIPKAFALVVGLLLAAFVAAPPALSFTGATQIAKALETSPVYIESGYSGALSAADAQSLEQQITNGSTPIYIAALADATTAALGKKEGALVAIKDSLGRPGTYAVVDSQGFRAAGTQYRVSALASKAAKEHPGDVAAMLGAFVTDVQTLAAGGSPEAAGPQAQGSASDSGSVHWGFIVFCVGAGIVALLLVRVGMQRRRTERALAARKLEELKAVLQEDITQIGEQITRVDDRDPRLTDDGRAELGQALTAYDRARTAADRLARPEDAHTVTAALDDARFAMACVSARQEGKPIPVRQPPCFFDPRHGMSTSTVMWAPPGVAPHDTPVCDACNRNVRLGLQPDTRLVPGPAGAPVPYYQGGRHYAPYAGGYYSNYGDVFGAIMVGTMVGSLMSGPGGMWGPDSGTGFLGGVAGGGDSGGGDFGGGDFGGGDFGGDFGGGDW